MTSSIDPTTIDESLHVQHRRSLKKSTPTFLLVDCLTCNFHPTAAFSTKERNSFAITSQTLSTYNRPTRSTTKATTHPTPPCPSNPPNKSPSSSSASATSAAPPWRKASSVPSPQPTLLSKTSIPAARAPTTQANPPTHEPCACCNHTGSKTTGTRRAKCAPRRISRSSILSWPWTG